MIFQSVFSMETSVLYVVGRGRSVLPVHALHLTLFASGAALCVWRFGVVGFGYGELIALGAYVLLDRKVRELFPVSYRDALPWVLGFTPPLFALYVPPLAVPLLWLPLVAIAVRRRQREQIRGYVSYLRKRPSTVPA
jgi:PST family polysaccharide transporter